MHIAIVLQTFSVAAMHEKLKLVAYKHTVWQSSQTKTCLFKTRTFGHWIVVCNWKKKSHDSNKARCYSWKCCTLRFIGCSPVAECANDITFWSEVWILVKDFLIRPPLLRIINFLTDDTRFLLGYLNPLWSCEFKYKVADECTLIQMTFKVNHEVSLWLCLLCVFMLHLNINTDATLTVRLQCFFSLFLVNMFAWQSFFSGRAESAG